MAPLKLIKTRIMTHNKEVVPQSNRTPDSVCTHSAASSVCSETVSVEETPSVNVDGVSTTNIALYVNALSTDKMALSDDKDEEEVLCDKERVERSSSLKAEAVSASSTVCSPASTKTANHSTNTSMATTLGGAGKRKSRRNERRQRAKLKRLRKKSNNHLVSHCLDFTIFILDCILCSKSNDCLMTK